MEIIEISVVFLNRFIVMFMISGMEILSVCGRMIRCIV